MVTSMKFTSADLELMPEDGKRYEIIEGELYVSKQPSVAHQYGCSRLCQFLGDWNDESGLGVVLTAPGLILGEDDDVAPDVVWITRERLALATDSAGHLLTAPELVIEVLSPGKSNEDRDRRVKLKLYSRQGVHEYWILDTMLRQISIYRRDHDQLVLDRTLHADDTLESSLLPGFSCGVAKLFLSPPV